MTIPPSVLFFLKMGLGSDGGAQDLDPGTLLNPAQS